MFIDLVFGRLHREVHGDPVHPSRTAGLLEIVRMRDDLPHVSAAAEALLEITVEQVFEAELDMLVQAVAAAARA
jgi:hypothetical protein